MNLKVLARLRKQKGKTMDEISKKLGYDHRSTYKRLEDGSIPLRVEHLPILAKEFGISVGELAELLCSEEE